jgi:hypothetical protein
MTNPSVVRAPTRVDRLQVVKRVFMVVLALLVESHLVARGDGKVQVGVGYRDG